MRLCRGQNRGLTMSKSGSPIRLLAKEDVIHAARKAGLSGPEVIERRTVVQGEPGPTTYWLMVGRAEHRLSIAIDPAGGQEHLDQAIAALVAPSQGY